MFGILKRNGKVYKKIVPDAQKEIQQAIIRGKVNIKSLYAPINGEVITVWLM